MSKVKEEVNVGANIPEQGLSSEGKDTTLLANFIESTKEKIKEVGARAWHFKLIRIRISQLGSWAEVFALKSVVLNIIEQNGTVVSETYKTEEKGPDNYKVTIISTYEINGNIQTVELNGYTSNFNTYQLEHGYWTLAGDMEYEKIELNHTDHEFESNITLPNEGFKFYYGHQIVDRFSTKEKNEILKYINEVKELSLNINEIEVNKLVMSVEDNTGKYQTGDDIDLDSEVKQHYFYLSISSDVVVGTFNLLISNVPLLRKLK